MTAPRIALDLAATGFAEWYRIRVYHGILDYARRHTAWELMYNVPNFSLINKFERYEDLTRLGASGIIFSFWDDDKRRRLEALGLPAVTISSDSTDQPFPAVLSDDEEVGRLAARHLLERGFRSLGFCGSSWVTWEVKRREGFRDEAARAGVEIHVAIDEPIPDPGRDAVTARELAAWLRGMPKPAGVMGADDTRALHLLEACHGEHLRVPADVAIVGCDNNVLICDSRLPSLSSVEQDTERVGYEAAALLDKLIRGQAAGAPVITVPPRGVVTRMSSDVIAVDDPAVAAAIHFMRDHAGESFGIEQLVAATGVSRRTLERRFRERLGQTLHDHLRDLRLAKAKRLLIETRLPLQTIAELSGFRRATYLCSIFREVHQQSPNEWRAMRAAPDGAAS